MYDNQVANHHDAITRVYAEQIIRAFREQMQEAERLAGELQDLLKNYETSIEREGASEHIETLVQWAESYSSSLLDAGKISRDGQAWLHAFGQRLKNPAGSLASEERIYHMHAASTASMNTKAFPDAASRKAEKISRPAAAYSLGLFPIKRERVRT